MDDFLDRMISATFVVVFVSVIALFIVIIGFGVFDATTGYSCKQKLQMMGLTGYHSPSTGCLVKIKNQLLPFDQIIAIERDEKIEFVTKYPHQIKMSTDNTTTTSN